MAKPKNNRALPLQIPANKGPDDIESKLLALYDAVDGKQVFLRELLYTGFLLRTFGVSQAIMDLERSGELDKLADDKKREAIAKIILGSNASLIISHKEKAEIIEEKPRVSASGLMQHGG